jgi:hypothetical protein
MNGNRELRGFWIFRCAVGRMFFFLLIIFQRKKEKKESRRESRGFKWSQVFLKKYYLTVVTERTHHSTGSRELKNVRVEIFSKTRRA